MVIAAGETTVSLLPVKKELQRKLKEWAVELGDV